MLEPIEAVEAERGRHNDFVAQVREIERWYVRYVRPVGRGQIGILLQNHLAQRAGVAVVDVGDGEGSGAQQRRDAEGCPQQQGDAKQVLGCKEFAHITNSNLSLLPDPKTNRSNRKLHPKGGSGTQRCKQSPQLFINIRWARDRIGNFQAQQLPVALSHPAYSHFQSSFSHAHSSCQLSV